MGECLRKTCPCLKTFWDRIFGSSADDGESSIKTDSDFTGEGPVNTETDRYTQPQPQPQPQPPQHPSPKSAVYTALWDFEARDGQELSFKEGDMFEIVNNSGDWWTAKKIDSFGSVTTGFVPFNYLARAESIEFQP